jgi:hypothetical protein
MSNGNSSGDKGFGPHVIPEDITRRIEAVVKPGPIDFQEVKVVCHLLSSSTLRIYVEELVDSLNVTLKVQGSESVFEHEEMMAYLISLTVARVQLVNSQRSEFTWRDRLVIPAFFSLILQHLGKARDHSLGITINPELPKEVVEKRMKQNVVLAFSRRLEACGRFGFEFATQLPREVLGDWEFMTMQYITGQAEGEDMSGSIVRHTSDAHPAKAILSSLVAMQGLKSVLTPRVEYGLSGLFEALVRDFAHVRGT